MPIEERQLKDLVSVGPAMLEDFELLGLRRWRSFAGEVLSECTGTFLD